jgi:DNA adenine methylase
MRQNLLLTGDQIYMRDTYDIHADNAFTAAPHVIPYQGSKRLLGPKIAGLFPSYVDTLYEPFAGSAAITLFAAQNNLARRFVICDVYRPLVELWRMIVQEPQRASAEYEEIWRKQETEDDDYFFRVRASFNNDSDPAKFLYLVSRCVKNAVRFSSTGKFTQSHDRRRLGTRPDKMRQNIEAASALLRGRVEFQSGDFEACIASARPVDLVYMDPPYQGTSEGGDKRYFQGLSRQRVIDSVRSLSNKGIPFLLSYDGICGTKVYGDPLPAELQLNRLLLDAGKSTQATLNGNNEQTFESVYSPFFLQFKRTPREVVPENIQALCSAVTKHRAKGVVTTILDRGFVTKDQIEVDLGQAHAPRAAQDVKDEGIPLSNQKFKYPDQSNGSYYIFDLDKDAQEGKTGGRKPFPKSFKRLLLEHYGPVHAFTGEPFPEGMLSIDHRVPYAVQGDGDNRDPSDFMLIDATYQRRKSFACEKCPNLNERDVSVCKRCYWASPSDYDHSATHPIRQTLLSWNGKGELDDFNRIKLASDKKGQPIQTFLKTAGNEKAVSELPLEIQLDDAL